VRPPWPAGKPVSASPERLIAELPPLEGGDGGATT
jgi:hypothetical protein